MGEILTKEMLEEVIEYWKNRPYVPNNWVEYKGDNPYIWHRYYVGADNKVKHTKTLIGR